MFSTNNEIKKSGGYIIGYSTKTQEDYIENRNRKTVLESSHAREITKGDIRSDEVLQKEYMQATEVTLETREKIVGAFKKKLQVKENKIQLLEQRLERMEKKLKQKEDEFYMMQPKAARQYEVKKGDSLWKIAARRDTYKNPYMWIKIYNSNMSKIESPGLIYPGQLFDIPK